MYPEYIVKFVNNYALAEGFVYKHEEGRYYIPEYTIDNDGGLREYKSRYSWNTIDPVRFNEIIEEYPVKDCFFLNKDEFVEEFFADLF